MNQSLRAPLRYLVSLAGVAVGLGAPATALADQPASCPPGSWFCADSQQKPAAPAGQPVPGQQPLQPLPPAGEAPPPQPPTVRYQPSPPPPVVVYQPPPPVMVYRPEAPPPYYYQSRRPAARPYWGINAHLEGLMIGRGVAGNTSMGGLGFGLRYRLAPMFALEGDVDFVDGHDYNGYQRNETALSVNSLVFLNPRSHAQVYLLGGIGWSGAHVVDQSTGFDQNYSYFGAQAGIGLELRLSRHFAINGDIRGFIRGRIDNEAQYAPEFVNPQTGQTTNTSGGGLLTLGMTFYF
jgi:hypothetical protein